MKKLLIIILIILLGTLAYFTLAQGINVLKINVLSMTGIKDESNKLDEQIETAKNLTSVNFPQKAKELETSIKALIQQKEEYQDLVALSSTEELVQANQSQKYEIEVLWVIIGNHATKHGVTMKMDVTRASSGGADLYDLNFTVNGSYIGITDFLYALEDDGSLQFKIEQFSLLPTTTSSGTAANTSTLEGTFIVKDLNINISSSNIVTTDVNEGTSDQANTVPQ